ncbi:MAG: metal-dependent transcriptional regulator [Thermoplasmata archaeon]
MEPLQRLTRRQVDTLMAVAREESSERGAALKAVARSLGVRPPSALPHVAALESLGLVARRSGKTHLTSTGRRCLVEYQRHHRVAETLFADAGFSPDASCRAAREVDLALSHRTVETVCRAERHPRVCPHGEPIPPCDATEGARR